MASHIATLVAASGRTTFGYKGWLWPRVGSSQVIGDDAKTYLLANHAGWFEYEVADADATIETPNYVKTNRLSPSERRSARKILESDPDVAAPLQVPRVADAAARAALTVHDGDLVYQLDNDKLYLRASGAWVAVPNPDDIPAVVSQMNIAADVGEEAGNKIPVTLTLTDQDDETIALGEVFIQLFTKNGPSSGTQEAIALTTGTSLNTPTVGSGAWIWARAAAGVIVVEIDDKSTSLEGQLYLRCTPINVLGPTVTVAATFA